MILGVEMCKKVDGFRQISMFTAALVSVSAAQVCSNYSGTTADLPSLSQHRFPRPVSRN